MPENQNESTKPKDDKGVESSGLLSDLMQLRRYEIARFRRALDQDMGSEIGRLRIEAKLEICEAHLQQLTQIHADNAKLSDQP